MCEICSNGMPAAWNAWLHSMASLLHHKTSSSWLTDASFPHRYCRYSALPGLWWHDLQPHPSCKTVVQGVMIPQSMMLSCMGGMVGCIDSVRGFTPLNETDVMLRSPPPLLHLKASHECYKFSIRPEACAEQSFWRLGIWYDMQQPRPLYHLLGQGCEMFCSNCTALSW